MPPRKSVDDKLVELEALDSEPDPARRAAGIEAALGDRHCRVVARAAKLASDGLLYDVVAALTAAYRRFLDRPVKTDPTCLAKKAIVHALVALDYDDAAFFLEALRYSQHEPVWGGTTDTAVDVRRSAAMGLVASGDPRALIELAELLADSEAEARAGAVRAIACGNPREAELLLRAKVVLGDAEPAVIGECFTGLLAIEPDESPPFVARYLSDADEAIRELAALALGESRLDAAFGHLERAWEDAVASGSFRRALIRAAAAHRSDAAFDWLTSLLETAHPRTAEDVLDALAIFRQSSKLLERIAAALERRGDRQLQEKLAQLAAPG
jgi:HEAT repeat protein